MIEIVKTEAGLAALAPAWGRLWARSATATPFQSPQWLLPWWRQFGTGLVRVAVARAGDELAGVLPLYILPGERKALPIGAGTTDYLDGLGDTAALVPAVLDRLRADPVDRVDLFEVPPWSRLAGVAAPGWSAEWGAGSPCPVLTLPTIPAGIRRKLRMNRNRAERAGGWTVQTAQAETLAENLGSLIRLHQARWTAQGETGALADPAVLAFWGDAAADLLAAGLLRLQVLRVAGQVAASVMALLAPGRIFFYLSGFDEEQAFVSPGTLLLGAMLEQAVAEGRTEAHFLRGQERYKYAWGAVDRCNHSGRFVPLSSVDST